MSTLTRRRDPNIPQDEHCERCDGCRWVCEAHPERPWEGPCACGCGAIFVHHAIGVCFEPRRFGFRDRQKKLAQHRRLLSWLEMQQDPPEPCRLPTSRAHWS
jgi:hypothetical protein